MPEDEPGGLADDEHAEDDDLDLCDSGGLEGVVNEGDSVCHEETEDETDADEPDEVDDENENDVAEAQVEDAADEDEHGESGKRKAAAQLKLRVKRRKVGDDSKRTVKSFSVELKKKVCTEENGRSFIVITHYQRLLDYIEPDFVHVMVGGRLVKSGTKELALELEERGYDWIIEGLEGQS